MNTDDAPRKRKTHKKSRAGCSNCKLRRVKCDESKPQCNKCREFHVACTYTAKAIKDPGELSSFSSVSLRPVVSTHELMLDMIHDGHISTIQPVRRSVVYRLDHSDLATIDRFQNRTVRTIGSPRMSEIMRNEFVKYAFKVGIPLAITRLILKDPPLMHALLALTHAHDRIEISPFAEPTAREAYHSNIAIQTIRVAMQNPENPQVSETTWATATLMGAVSFCTLEGHRPEDFWPMKETQLVWLKMSEGKSIMHNMMVSKDPSSPANKLAQLHHAANLSASIDYGKLAVLPTGFLEVFDISPDTGDQNPYLTAIYYLAQLWPLKADRSNILLFMSFVAKMDPGFRRVLLIKDPRALLLTAWWWAMASRFTQWWHGTRARLECQALCLYLNQHHGGEWYIREFLPYAQTGCGLADGKSLSDISDDSPTNGKLA